jgi:hypothetical protein
MEQSNWEKSQRKTTFQFASEKIPISQRQEVIYGRLHRKQGTGIGLINADKTGNPSEVFLQHRAYCQPGSLLDCGALPLSEPSGTRKQNLGKWPSEQTVEKMNPRDSIVTYKSLWIREL